LYPDPGVPTSIPTDVGGTAKAAAHHVSTLPFTGVDVALLVGIAVLLLVAGLLLARGIKPTATHGDHFE